MRKLVYGMGVSLDGFIAGPDEYRLFVNPVAVGGGTPFFPELEEPLELELAEERTFGRVVYLCYRAV